MEGLSHSRQRPPTSWSWGRFRVGLNLHAAGQFFCASASGKPKRCVCVVVIVVVVTVVIPSACRHPSFVDMFRSMFFFSGDVSGELYILWHLVCCTSPGLSGGNVILCRRNTGKGNVSCLLLLLLLLLLDMNLDMLLDMNEHVRADTIMISYEWYRLM